MGSALEGAPVWLIGDALEGAPVWLIAYRGELWKNEVWLGEGEKTDFSMSLKMLKG